MKGKSKKAKVKTEDFSSVTDERHTVFHHQRLMRAALPFIVND